MNLPEVLTPSRWQTLCSALNLRDGLHTHRALLRAWSGWGRHYHTLAHLAACLRELDLTQVLAERPADIAMALWFHDAIYRTYRHDNEARSADWAARFLTEQNAAPQVIKNVRQWILATVHAPGVLHGDAALLVDIDLSILGQAPDTYDAFERNVRREYWWVPRQRYNTARTTILQSFLDRPRIYHWPAFQERYETTARENLQRAISTCLQ